MALFGHADRIPRCPLTGAKQTSRRKAATSVFDPTETFRNAASAARVCRHLLFDVWSQGVSAAGSLGGVTVEDSKPLLSIGWTTQNNLEIRETELMASRLEP
jgi:hypothetical protein